MPEKNTIAITNNLLENNAIATPSNLLEKNSIATTSNLLENNAIATPSNLLEKNSIATTNNLPEKNSIAPPASNIKGKNNISENTIIIYTDGASSGNPGPGGIGVYLKFREHEKEISESIGHTTNNIAELTAIQRALLELKRHDLPVRLYTDSSYALGILTKGWKASKNQELVADIRKLIGKFKDIRFIKTKGHAGIEGNERADTLATRAIKK
ncbi:MAG: reverse transcriptase-like protein [Desulfamplus sp.]|nr:reverse transcriptase-like protein [Desulfamplus sp.]